MNGVISNINRENVNRLFYSPEHVLEQNNIIYEIGESTENITALR